VAHTATVPDPLTRDQRSPTLQTTGHQSSRPMAT
jgi:hypothetical protein